MRQDKVDADKVAAVLKKQSVGDRDVRQP